MSRIDLVIFDFDGVIADSETLANTVLSEAITALGHPTSVDDFLRLYLGRHWTDCTPIIEETTGFKLPATFVADQVATMHARLEQELQAVEGAVTFLETLSRRRCIASSGTPDYLELALRRLGLADHFGPNVFSGAKHVSRGKPHPDIFLYAAEQMGVAPDNTVVIEDSPAGVQAGVAAGMTVIGLLAGGHIREGHGARLSEAGAHYLARSYDEVGVVFRSMGRTQSVHGGQPST